MLTEPQSRLRRLIKWLIVAARLRTQRAVVAFLIVGGTLAIGVAPAMADPQPTQTPAPAASPAPATSPSPVASPTPSMAAGPMTAVPATVTPSATPFLTDRSLFDETPTPASATPTRRTPQVRATIPSWVLPYLPTTIVPTPQPSAFFVPRLITVTAGLEDATGSRLQGRVLDWRGNGMSGVAVRASSQSGERSALTDYDGTYLFDGLPAGTYAVSVAGYEGIPVSSLPVDGQSIFIVEFIEGARPSPAAATPTPSAVAGQRTPTPASTPRPAPAAAGPPSLIPQATASGTAATPTVRAGLATPGPKQDSQLLSNADLDYLRRTLVPPFLLGAAGSYIIFMLGLLGARFRR